MSNTPRQQMRANETRRATSRVTVYSGPTEAMWPARDLVESKDAKAGRQVIAIHPGGGGAAQAAEWHANLFERSYTELRRHLKVGSSRKLDLTSNEGREQLRTVCREHRGAVVTFAYEPRKDAPASIALALTEMQAMAKEFGVHVKIFASNCGPQHDELQEYSDEYLEVLACERDPGNEIAFALFHVEHQLNFYSGEHRTMWRAKKGSSGKLVRRSEPFVHEKVNMRFKHELRRHNWTYQEIADLFDVNVSTIWRELQAIPVGEKINEQISEERLTMFMEYLNLQAPGSAKREDTDLMPDEELLECDDDEPLTVADSHAKTRPAAKKRGRKR